MGQGGAQTKLPEDLPAPDNPVKKGRSAARLRLRTTPNRASRGGS